MSSPSKFQTAALSIMDYIFIHDLLNYSSRCLEKTSYFSLIGRSINRIVKNHKLNTKDQQFYKHMLLCAMEILLATPQESLVEKHIDLLKTAFTNQINRNHSQIDINQFDKDLNHLKHLTKFTGTEKKHEFGYKLVSYFLYFDYITLSYKSSTLSFLTDLLRRDIFELGKFQNKKCTGYFLENETLFFRALLFIEFEVFKLYYLYNDFTISSNATATELNLTSGYLKIIESFKNLDYTSFQSIYQIDLDNTPSIEEYIINISSHLNHNNILLKNKSNVATYCSGLLVHYITNSKSIKITNAESDNVKESATAIAKYTLSKYGITISEQTIYINYCVTKDIYLTIQKMLRMVLEEGGDNIFREDIILLFFRHPTPSQNYLELRNEALSHIEKLQKNSS